MLRKSTNLLLTRTLSSCLQNLIKKPHIGLTEVGGAPHRHFIQTKKLEKDLFGLKFQ